jgi:hypothetical protein
VPEEPDARPARPRRIKVGADIVLTGEVELLRRGFSADTRTMFEGKCGRERLTHRTRAALAGWTRVRPASRELLKIREGDGAHGLPVTPKNDEERAGAYVRDDGRAAARAPGAARGGRAAKRQGTIPRYVFTKKHGARIGSFRKAWAAACLAAGVPGA